MIERRDRIRGGVLGLLIGDALGVPYEFHGPEQIPDLDEIEMTPPADFARAHVGTPPGTWSDDGAQALALLASLLERDALDLDDFSRRLVAWLERGELAVDGRVFDVGNQTSVAIGALTRGTAPERAGPSGEFDNGNGSLMRVLPLALWHQGSDDELIADAMRSSLPTHAHLRSQLCCALYCVWARRVLEGAGLEPGWRAAVELIEAAAAGQPGGQVELEAMDLHRDPAGGGSGYVVDCLHSARLVLLDHDSYEDVVKAAIALGNDTDTTAAVAGGLAGVQFGAAAIPDHWRATLRGRALLDPLLDQLLPAH